MEQFLHLRIRRASPLQNDGFCVAIGASADLSFALCLALWVNYENRRRKKERGKDCDKKPEPYSDSVEA